MGIISDLTFDAGIAGLPSNQAVVWGFRSGDRGTHTSRTIMLDELSHLLPESGSTNMPQERLHRLEKALETLKRAGELLFSHTAIFVVGEDLALSRTFDWKAFFAPFHSVVLHLPIGFLTIAFILEIYSFFNQGRSMRRAVGLVLWLSVFSAAIASALGYLRGAGGGYEANALAFHQWTGITTTVLMGIAACLHVFAFPRKGKRRLFFASTYRFVLVIAVGVLMIAGHYGGNLTHGSKYLFENAPEWVGTWLEETEAKVTEKIAEETGLEIVAALETGSDGVVGTGFYADVIQPVFEQKCYQCHGAEKQKGDYRMDTVAGLFAAGDSEIDPIVKGRPLESYLVEVISLPEDDDFVMPPTGKEALTGEEILAIMRWIWDGAETGAEEADPEEKTDSDSRPM